MSPLADAARIVCCALCFASVACSTADSGGGSADSGNGGSGGTSASGGSGGTGLSAGGGGSSGSGGTGGAAASGSGGSGGTSGSGGAGGAAAASGAGGSTSDAGPCTPIGLDAFQLLDTEPGGASLAYGVTGLSPGKQNVAYIEFYNVAGPQTAGKFDLSQPPDDNYSTCAHCLLVYEDLAGSPTAFFPIGGSLNLTTADATFQGNSAGSFDSVTLVEVTVQSTVTTPVPGGRCLTLSGSWKHP